MRLLNTIDHSCKEFFGSELPKYAILSHRWIRDEEVSYEDFVGKCNFESSGYRKIIKSCERAQRYLWRIDMARIMA